MRDENQYRLGFTLFEVLLVVIIIGVMATIAVPKYNIAIEKFRSQEGANLLFSLYGSEKRYKMDAGEFTSGASFNGSGLDIIETGETLALKYFDQPILMTTGNVLGGNPCSSTQKWISYISRSSGWPYILCVDESGDVSCKEVGSDICNKMGYTSL